MTTKFSGLRTQLWQRIGVGVVVPSLVWTTALIAPIPAGQAQSVPTANQVQGRQVDLSALRSHLQAQDWQAADAETRRILQGFVHPSGDVFGEPAPTLLPPEVLQAIDDLWSEASGGRFGFSAQLAIWDEFQTQNFVDTQDLARAFGDRVGWTRPMPDPNNFVSPDWLTEPELTYTLEAPPGHLPWVGLTGPALKRC